MSIARKTCRAWRSWASGSKSDRSPAARCSHPVMRCSCTGVEISGVVARSAIRGQGRSHGAPPHRRQGNIHSIGATRYTGWRRCPALTVLQPSDISGLSNSRTSRRCRCDVPRAAVGRRSARPGVVPGRSCGGSVRRQRSCRVSPHTAHGAFPRQRPSRRRVIER